MATLLVVAACMEPGHGSSFSCTLPLTKGSAASNTAVDEALTPESMFTQGHPGMVRRQ
ncbi:MAG: hypothetical protein ACYDH4_12210 [Candidatus Cryosericum sp.]